MRIRPILPGELDTFTAFNRNAAQAEDARQYVARMLAAGTMRQEWCFVATDDTDPTDGITGTLGLWALPDAAAPTDFVLLELPWEGDYLAVGDGLLGHTFDTMRRLGSAQAGYVLDIPPLAPYWQGHAAQRAEVLERAGFALVRETLRFEWRAGRDALPEPSARLRYRSLADVGEEAFVAAVERISVGTFDRSITQFRREMGDMEAARYLYALVAQLGYDPAWWQLAYADEGTLVGLHMPAQLPDAATIGYIGVVPEQRGHGYINDLLAQCTRTLAGIGAGCIIADTDTGNHPMAAAFRRGGYAEFARRREYSRKL